MFENVSNVTVSKYWYKFEFELEQTIFYKEGS